MRREEKRARERRESDTEYHVPQDGTTKIRVILFSYFLSYFTVLAKQ